jgi:hypothetical protein
MVGGTIVLWGSYELLHRHGFALMLNKAKTNPPVPLSSNSANAVRDE